MTLSPDPVLAKIQAMRRIPFSSTSCGAVILARFGYGLPASESFPTLPKVEIACAAVERTIRHPHSHQEVREGDGRRFVFQRHVTEGEKRWDFEVEVWARSDGTIAIDDARVTRPSEPDEEDEGSAVEPQPAPRREAVAPAGMVACPCCGHATLESRGEYEICPVCFWEDDGQDNADAGEARGGPNPVSLTEARQSYLRTRASCAKDLGHVRAPTLEEVQLRRFDAEGREIGG